MPKWCTKFRYLTPGYFIMALKVSPGMPTLFSISASNKSDLVVE